MKRVYLFLLIITICTLTSCGFRVEANEDKMEKLCRIEIQATDGTNIITLDEQLNKEMVDLFDDAGGNWNTALSYSDEGLTPQYIINVYQEKTPTVIRTENTDAYEKVMIYTTYEDSDIVKVAVDDNAIHGVTYGISEDFLTFYYKGTEEFFSILNNVISDASDS